MGEKMQSFQIKAWMEAATILGLIVVGGLAATWLNMTTPLTYTTGEASVANAFGKRAPDPSGFDEPGD